MVVLTLSSRTAAETVFTSTEQCSSGGSGIHRKIPKVANKTFSKSFKKYLTQPNSCDKVQSSTRAQLVE